MDTRRLTETAFRATFTAPMRDITRSGGARVDIWPYVDALGTDDCDGLALQAREVRYVSRDAYDRYDHVLLPLAGSNTYLVIVVDLRLACIHGHHVLRLGEPAPQA